MATTAIKEMIILKSFKSEVLIGFETAYGTYFNNQIMSIYTVLFWSGNQGNQQN